MKKQNEKDEGFKFIALIIALVILCVLIFVLAIKINNEKETSQNCLNKIMSKECRFHGYTHHTELNYEGKENIIVFNCARDGNESKEFQKFVVELNEKRLEVCE